MNKVIVSWSGGKDSAFALYVLSKQKEVQVRGLLSTTSEESGRLPMHEVKRKWIHRQAEALGLPLYEVKLPERADNVVYEQRMREQFDKFKVDGISTIVHADLYLEDIRQYRDKNLSEAGMKGLYPLWKRDTLEVAKEFVDRGFQAIVTTVDKEKLPKEMAGQFFDESFLGALPDTVDPCGENGEFHTFVFDGPIFHAPVRVKAGQGFETFDGQFAHAELAEW